MGKIGKEKEEKSGRKGKNQEGSFTLLLLTERAGYTIVEPCEPNKQGSYNNSKCHQTAKNNQTQTAVNNWPACHQLQICGPTVCWCNILYCTHQMFDKQLLLKK